MNNILEIATAAFAAGGVSGPEAFRAALVAEMALGLKWPWVLEALAAEDPMAPDYEALGAPEPTSQYADSRESAEAPGVQ